MAKKESRISVNKLEDIVKENNVVVPMIGNEEVKITIRRVLPLEDVMQFVTDVVSSCVNPDTGEYIPEAKDFAIKSGILSVYANFNLPSKVEKQYDLIYRTDVVEQVVQYIDRNQFQEIRDAIDENISHKIRVTESIAAAQVRELMARVSGIVEQVERLFGTVGEDGLGSVVQKIAQMGDINEESLAKAVLNTQAEQSIQRA